MGIMQITAAHKKAVDQYYRELTAYKQQDVTHETAVRSAFQFLLGAFAPSVNWMLIPEEPLANGKRPDGTLRDTFRLPRGYWEAKDTRDDLLTEIRKKIHIGYPTTNTIFEDTRRAFLYQNNKLAFEANLAERDQLLDLLRLFFSYTEPDIATFEAAVDEFKQRIPDLAQGLLARISEEHAKNPKFVSAFAAFLELCRTSLNPQISRETVDEMLVQHLLTERLFRTIFNNPDFINRNVIAAEIEKVIRALTSRAFNRNDFERSLDRFYIAIEGAAKTLDNWTEKQHFLDTVYERFFQGFSIKQADTHGIVYTPQEIVEFMCASVEEVLQREFHTSLSTPGVQVLDPCVGTGNFIVNILRRISGSTLAHKYAHDLFCNEIMLLPYYIASLNIEHAYYERTGQYQSFEGICFADTLELAQGQQPSLFVEENTERVEREKAAPIMVVIGNPPYNAWQKSENDNNKNRRYPVIDERIRQTYVKDSNATLNNTLYDSYIRFFRWATDRLQGRDGVVCFVSNNSFVDQIAFAGMRKHLLQDFNLIYHLDLHGNTRKNPSLSGTTHNVFGIRVGVGITVAVRNSQYHKQKLYYFRVPEHWRKTEKMKFLSEKHSISGIEWSERHANERNTWLVERNNAEFADFLVLGTKQAKVDILQKNTQVIFKAYYPGVATGRDDVVYDFNIQMLIERIDRFIGDYNGEVSRWSRGERSKDIDSFVQYDKVKWSEHLKDELKRERYGKLDSSSVRIALYRPFCKRFLYYDRLLNDRPSFFRETFPTIKHSEENKAICLTDIGSEKPFMVMVADTIPDRHLVGAGSSAQCFPYYTYAEDGSNRRENITDWALAQFKARYGEQVTKWDIFHYVYAMLHHPQYRERYAENLKRELPRMPLLKDCAAFATCVRIGKQLMELHLHYEQAQEYPLTWLENNDVPVSWYVKKMRLSADKSSLEVNEWLTLTNIPQQCFQYRLGNRSALEWVIDQYQVSTDKRNGITSNPNQLDDEQYIVRLVGKVITVSVETVKLVEELARDVRQEEWVEKSERE
jgi:predicted helicase